MEIIKTNSDRVLAWPREDSCLYKLNVADSSPLHWPLPWTKLLQEEEEDLSLKGQTSLKLFEEEDQAYHTRVDYKSDGVLA